MPAGEDSLKIRLAVSPEYRRVTDGRTDGQTSCDGILRWIIVAYSEITLMV